MGSETGDVKYDIRLNTEDKLTKINAQAKQAVKEFAERLKEKLFDLGNIVNENDIDETLKEFINE